MSRSSLVNNMSMKDCKLVDFGLSTFKAIFETGVSEGRKTFHLLLF